MEKVEVIFIAEYSIFESYHTYKNLKVYKGKKQSEIEGEEDIEVTKIDSSEIDFTILNLQENQLEPLEDFAMGYNVINCDRKSIAKNINRIISNSNNEYFCIIPTNIFFDIDWLLDLTIYSNTILNAGICGVVNDFSNKEFSYALTSDIDFSQIVIHSPTIEGVVFFNRNTIDNIGYLDEDERLCGYELKQYCLRANYFGLNNFYLANQTTIFNPKLIIEPEYLNDSINNMRKSKNFYIHFSTN
jgi:hypothetical protein